ncbi:hypothetical protein [Flavobacterium covae]|uniref:hypothetical protein n=1 Tax=Flavobacterium TaxID=237 RepID=UPI000745AE4F|nr:hypothetical protein [Flavobacterium covae]AMA49767.1 hypothetical protein AWN65_10025 [Flavobacterium covae]MCJ1809772.1 hypothetical protein [Flavobacterium covae]
MSVPLRVGLSVLSFAERTIPIKKSHTNQQKDDTSIPHASLASNKKKETKNILETNKKKQNSQIATIKPNTKHIITKENKPSFLEPNTTQNNK